MSVRRRPGTPGSRAVAAVFVIAWLGLMPSAASAAPSLVQQKTGNGNNVGSLTVTLTNPTTVGNLLLMVGANWSCNLANVTGGGVTTWSKATASTTNSNIEIWYGVVSTSSSTGVTATLNTACGRSTGGQWMNLTEWSGLFANQSTVLDQAAARSGSTASVTASATGITTTNANDLLIFGATEQNGQSFGSPSPGSWTSMTFITTPSQQSSWYRVVSSTGTYNPASTESGPNTPFAWDAALSSFKACGAVSDPGYVTANAQNGRVTVYWSSGTSVVVLRKTSAFSTEKPGDGLTYTAGTTPGGTVGTATVSYVGSAGSFTDTSLSPTTTYYYKVFANSSACYSAGVSVNGTPAVSAPQWSYDTTATTMAPPGLSPNDVVIAGSNDNNVHGINASSGTNGTMAFPPFPTGNAIQSRPAVIPAAYSVTALDIAYVTSQDDSVYALDTNTGAQVWKSPNLVALQGGTAVWLQAVKALTICGTTTDVVFVGTRNTGTTTANKVHALNGGNTTVTSAGGGNCVASGTNVAPGAVLWTFTGGNPNPKMHYISSTPLIDYANNVIWVTSRANGGTAQPSLWKLNVSNGTLPGGTSTWNLNDIDSSPTASADGNFIYVGTNAGKLVAVNVGTGATVTHTPVSTPPCNCTGSGAVKGAPWPLSSGTVTAATPDTIVFSRNATVHSVDFDGAAFAANWTMTPTGAPAAVSAPVDDGAGNLYVGGSDGKVHRIVITTGADASQVSAPASATLGDPAYDVTLGRVYIGASDGHIYAFTAGF